jgi:hypothetical protein
VVRRIINAALDGCKEGAMKKLITLVLACLAFGAAPTAFAGDKGGCSILGSWYGLDGQGAIFTAVYHGISNSSGTIELEGTIDPSLGGRLPAVAISNGVGTWARTGGNTFVFTTLVFGLDSIGQPVWIGKFYGTKTLSDRCSTQHIVGGFDIFLANQDPFVDSPIAGQPLDYFAPRVPLDPSLGRK